MAKTKTVFFIVFIHYTQAITNISYRHLSFAAVMATDLSIEGLVRTVR